MSAAQTLRDAPAVSAAAPDPSDSITFCHSVNKLRLTKYIDAAGLVHDAEQEKYFDARQVPVAGLDALYGLLKKALGDQHAFVVRGHLLGGPKQNGILRRSRDDRANGEKATLADAPSRWLAIDVDGVRIPDSLNRADLKSCAEHATIELPRGFQGVRAIVCATGGHGKKPGARLRLWYWLSRPITCAEAKFWLRGLDKVVDLNIYSPASAIFTAAPIFETGVVDHLPDRIAMLEGPLPEAEVPAKLEAPERKARKSGEALASIENVRAALEAIPNDKLPWDEWVRIGMAVHAATEGSEDGLEAFHLWSAKYAEKYDSYDVENRWSHWFDSPADDLGYGTLAYLATQAVPGWRAPSWAPLNSPAVALAEFEATAVLDHIEFSDDGLAVGFAREHIGQLYHVATTHDWLAWNGTHYQTDTRGMTWNLARLLCRKEATKLVSKDAKAAHRLSSAQAVAATIKLASSDPVFARSLDDFDADPWIINTPGGILDLRTGELRGYRKSDLCTKVAGAAPGGDCPRWRAFLREITQSDQQLVDYLQRFIGYTLTGAMGGNAFLFAYGPGGNGKSVLLATVAALLGTYAATAMPDLFTETRNEQHPAGMAALAGARMVVVAETDEGRPWAEAKIKSWTGGDRQTARVMRGNPFSFSPMGKLWFAGNHKPPLRNPDAAMRRRMNLVPLTYVPAVPDTGLPDALKAELGGIMAWAVQGCLAWQKTGLLPPAVVTSATDVYFEDQDLLARWVDERCEIKAAHRSASGLLYCDWSSWAIAHGVSPRGDKWFSGAMERRFEKKRAKTGMEFVGLALRPGASPVE